MDTDRPTTIYSHALSTSPFSALAFLPTLFHHHHRDFQPTTLQLNHHHHHHHHHHHACLRILLQVRRHDCHQHHLHRLWPQAMHRVSRHLNNSSTLRQVPHTNFRLHASACCKPTRHATTRSQSHAHPSIHPASGPSRFVATSLSFWSTLGVLYGHATERCFFSSLFAPPSLSDGLTRPAVRVRVLWSFGAVAFSLRLHDTLFESCCSAVHYRGKEKDNN
jgi:hypothetical protein